MTIGYKSFVLKPVFLVLLLATAVIMPSYSQTAVPGQTTLETDSSGSDASPVTIASLDDRLNLANTLPDYLVTPGDTYALSMAAGGGISSGLNRLELFVEEDYTVNMAFLGQVNGRGKTFSQLKQEILGIVRRAYPQKQSRPGINRPGKL